VPRRLSAALPIAPDAPRAVLSTPSLYIPPARPAGQRRRTPMLRILGCTTLVLAVVALAPSAASGRAVKQSLRPTGVDPNAQGVAMASIHAKRNRGKFRVNGRNLKP